MSKLPKNIPLEHVCPACTKKFLSVERREADGRCPHCRVSLKLDRRKKQSGTGFEYIFTIDEDLTAKRSETDGPGDALRYEVIETRGQYPLIVTEKLKEPDDNLPLYRVHYRPASAYTKCYCPRCSAYMFTNQVLRSGGSSGTVLVCRAKNSDLFDGQCKTKTAFIFE